MSDCAISIIIPAYNVEKYLEAALDSIKEQSVPPDEVILIDDGSSDRTLDIAQSYSFPFPYHVISIENGGQGNARNIGVRKATSEYVYFFDSDDILVKDFVRSLKKTIRENNSPDIFLFSGESFNDVEYKGSRWIEYSRGFSGSFNNRVKFLNKSLLHNSLFCSPCLYVSKKSFWGPQGLEFGSDFLEDEAIFYPLIFACNTFSVLNEVFFLRRNREGSTMTMKPNKRHANGALNCLHTTLRLYKIDGISAKERWHISKRLEGHCVLYLLMSKAAGIKCDYKEVFNAIVKTRNPVLAIKIAVYASGLNKIKLIRKTVRSLRFLRSKLSAL